MNTKFLKNAAMAGVIAALATSAEAMPITGSIGFAGEATLNAPTTISASEVLSWGANTIVGGSGTFASLGSAAAVALASPWQFNSGPMADFWRITDGAASYTFNLTSSYIAGSTAQSVTVALIGTVISNVTGLDATSFTGMFTVQNPLVSQNGTFQYSESMSFGAAASAVPDGGYTALLLGTGLVGMALIKRKLTVARLS